MVQVNQIFQWFQEKTTFTKECSMSIEAYQAMISLPNDVVSYINYSFANISVKKQFEIINETNDKQGSCKIITLPSEENSKFQVLPEIEYQCSKYPKLLKGS